MKNIKNLVLIILSLTLLSNGSAAQSKKKAAPKKKTTSVKPVVKLPPSSSTDSTTQITEYKVLIEGQYSKVETPFVFIARDPETYALIRSMVEGLPASTTVDFSKNAVVAAFLGERNTGGWTVAIRPIPGKTLVDVREPRKGSMTAQVISSPFQVVAVPLSEIQPLVLELTPTWTNKMQTYRVSKADFEYSGGIRGITKKFSAEGTIDVISYGDNVTYNFNLAGKGKDRGMKLSDMASGVINTGTIGIARLDTGSFSEMPHPPFKVTGTGTGQKISLVFESLPPTVADGFTGKGKLEAMKVK